MPGKNTLPFSKRVTISHFHRRRRPNTRRMISYLFEYFGDQLYYLGATVEREIKNTLRSFRRGAKWTFRAMGRFFLFVFKTVGRWIMTVLRDLVNPFLKIFRSLASLVVVMRETRKKGFRVRVRRFLQFFKYGWIWNRHLLARFLNQTLPVAALAALVFVAYGMLNLNFALAVSYNNQVVGYIVNEQVLESAQRIIRGRMVEAEEGGWTADVRLSVAVVSKDSLVSQRGMADNLLKASGTGVSEAAGLYIADTFIGATTEGELLEHTLDDILKAYRHEVIGEEITDIRFAQPVELREGVYPTSSVRPIEILDEFVNSARRPAVFYTVGEEETIESIADQNGVTIELLRALNPGMDFENLLAGESLMLADEEPMLPVKVVRIEAFYEDIPVEDEIYSDSKFDQSFSFEFFSGEPGLKEVIYEIEYVNGVVTSKVATKETVIREMVKRTVVKGTKAPVGLGGRPPTTAGILGWPTGAFVYISRGSAGGNHIAVDISCVTGTNVFAAASGTVVQSVWSTYGYGYYIEIDHGIVDGVPLRTLYAHHSDNLVEVGQYVEKGQLIAYSGSTGNSTGPHLHFEVRVNGERTPPEPWLGIEIMGDRW